MSTTFRPRSPLLLMLPLMLLAAACGQKGPLYLPGSPSEVRTSVPPGGASAPAPDDTSEDDDQDEQR